MFPLAVRRLAAVSTRGAVQRSRASFAPLLAPQRGFASAAASKLVKTLAAEIKHEDEQYEQAKEIKAFLKSSEWKLSDTDGDVNLALERTVGDDKVVRIEWQLSSPFSPEDDADGELQADESTEFQVTIEGKTSGAGMTFYCSTQTGEDHRYIIGNLKAYEGAEERDSVSGFNGPDFEDVDDKLQEAFDEYLGEVGMNNELCDFIDATGQDKEQREYIRWLKITRTFLET